MKMVVMVVVVRVCVCVCVCVWGGAYVDESAGVNK